MGNPIQIVISGYYGFDNIGDEAVLHAIIDAVREAVNDAKIIVLSNNPEKTKVLYDVEAVNRWHIKEIIKTIKESDMLISGGGSLLQDVTSNKTIPYYLGIIKIAQWYKKKIVFYSQGVGPINHKANKWLVKLILNKIDGLFVRDQQSKKVLERIGIKKSIRVSADPVLGIKPSEDVYKLSSSLPNWTKTVGVFIRPWENEAAVLESLEDSLNYLVKEGYKICLIPMYYQQDRDIAYKLKAMLQGNAVIIDKMISLDEVMGYIASFELIIGMRLHSLIMAAALKVPMIGLSYDPKVKDFMKDMSIPYCIDVESISGEELTHMTKELIGHLDQAKDHLSKMYEIQMKKVNLPAEYIKSQLL